MRDSLKRLPPNEVADVTRPVAGNLAMLEGPRTRAQEYKTNIGREIESSAGELMELMPA